MTVEISREVAPGVRFSVLSDGHISSGPVIVIPVEHLSKFTAAQLHDVLWGLEPLARLSAVEGYAERLVLNCGGRPVPSWVLDSEISEIEELLKYEGHGGYIDQAIVLVHKTQERNHNRSTSKPKRAELSKTYNNTFMKIGRRDGFRCAHCEKSDDLVIDHVKALINGGTNDLDNLQLLCSSCNARKSDK